MPLNGMTFNQFQKELTNRSIDRQTAYLLTMLFEQNLNVAEQIDDMANAVIGFADILKGFVQLNQQTQEALIKLGKRGLTEGVDVRSMSVAEDPNEAG